MTYAPFGLGAHACVAAELVVALGGLPGRGAGDRALRRYPLAADGYRVLGTYHWEPAPGFAVRLAPRTMLD